MTKLNSSAKLRVIAIISCAIIIIGMALGTVFHFVSNGFFNYGGEYASYKSVTVSYSLVEVNGENFDVEGICTAAFDEAGVKYYAKMNGSALRDVKQVEYRFATSENDEALNAAVEAINKKISEDLSGYLNPDVIKSVARLSENDGLLGGGFALWRAAVALAVIVVAQLIYTMIRFRFSAAFTAIAMDLHNIAIFAAVLAICRIPVTSAAMVFAVLLTLVTAIGVTFTLERIRRNAKENTNLSVEDLASLSARQTVKTNVALPALLAVVAVLFFVAVAVSALSLIPALVPMLLALVAFAIAVYGNVVLMPQLYIFIKNTGKKLAAKPSKKQGN